MIPILGQQFSILGYVLLPLIQCECERKGVVTLMLQQRAEGIQRTQEHCPSCGKVFTLRGVQGDAEGRLAFAVEVGTPSAVAMD